MNEKKINNPLGTEPVGTLIRKFAIPSIISMLVMSFYNIVDQFFIGRTVGPLGNAATNISFPLTTLCIATALAFGIGGAAGFNLNMGAGNKEKAIHFVGNAITMMFSIGILVTIVTSVFLKPILLLFGAPDSAGAHSVLGYSVEYVRVLALGFPFAILSAGGAHLIRADGSPRYSMICNVAGAFCNVILDYLFVMRFGWGMTGAATATVIGQVLSFSLVVYYLVHYKTATIEKRYLVPQREIVLKTVHLGMAQCLNQLAIMVVQIVMNKSLTYYGALSSYGQEIPLACVGIIMKVNQVYFSICIGVSQGMQPIASFNRGANQFARVRKAYKIACITNTVVSSIAFLIFQLFPRQIIGIFGEGSDAYFLFAEKFFRIFLFMTFLNGIQPITSTFCTAIGEPNKGAFLSLTRQIIFFLPLLIVMPMLFMQFGEEGINGIMYTAPISDFLAAAASLLMIRKIFSGFYELEKEVEVQNN